MEERGDADRLDRPWLTVLRDAVHAGLVDVVAVTDLERLARFPSDLALLRDEFTATGCVIVTIDPALPRPAVEQAA